MELTLDIFYLEKRKIVTFILKMKLIRAVSRTKNFQKAGRRPI